MKRLLVLFSVIILLSEPALAVEKGAVTNLPLPRFVSLKASKANARRGPSLSHRIDWVYKRKHMPLEIYAEYENWRRVRDIDGAGGWVHYSLLSGVRTAILKVNMQPLTNGPDENSNIVARFEKDVIAKIEKCELKWCQLTTGGYKGWVPKTSIWGVYDEELRD
ncbi:MAG: SH3 domain-containing protein [Paracoccaceae bacterium]|nr:SH3 domain-containing protein [Paracoccaceae bacterium]